MKLNFKKILLTGTALVAVSAFGNVAVAADEFVVDSNADGSFTTTGPDETADTAFNWQTNVNALSSQSKNVQVLLDGTITLETGDIIGSSTSGNAIVAGANAKTLTLRDLENGAASAVTVNGNITKGSFAQLNLTLDHATTDGADPYTMDINGNVDLGTGTLTVTSVNAGDTVGITLSGNLTAAATVLNETAGTITLTFDGTSAQTVSGTIDGNGDADGTLVIANAAGVTFNGAIGNTQGMNAINITNGTSNSAATFAAATKATGIVLGNNAGTDTNTVTFDATTASFAVTGAISANGATDTNNLVIGGGTGKTVTFATDMGTNIDGITINANSTLIGNTLNASTITLTSGSKVQSAADGKTWTAAINGAGSLDIDHNTTVVGSVGNTTALTNIDVIAGKTLTIDASGAARTVGAGSISLAGAGSTLAFTMGNNVTVNAPITATTADQGVITVSGAVGTVAMGSNAIGTSTNKLASLTLADNAAVTTFDSAANLYINAITINTNDVLNLTGSSQTVSGTINGGADGRGFVNVGSGSANANVTFSGVVGGTGDINGIKVFTGSTANISKTFETHTGTNDIDGTLNIDATANAVTFSAANAGNTDIDGTVGITGTSSTTSDNVVISAAGALTIDGTLTTNIGRAGKTTTLTGTTSATFGATSNTTINAYNQVVLGAATTIGANGRTTTLNMGKTATFDPDATTVYTSGANVTLAAGSTLNVGIASSSLALENNATVTVLTSAGGTNLSTALTGGQIVLVDTGLIDLQNDASDATNLKVKVVYNNVGTTLTSDYSENGATNLMALTTATDQLQTARGNLLAAPTAAAANEVAESLVPTVDGGHVVAAANVTNGSFGLMGDRLAALRTEQSGMAAGNGTIGNRLWAQGFGSMGDQDRRDGVDGYEADTFGGTIALDTETIAANGIVGVALSFANTEVDSKNANRTNTDVDTYQIALYGDYDLDQTTWLNGMVAYAWHDVNTIRHNVGGIAGLNASGDFDANQFTAQAEIGRDYTYESMILAPSFLAHWTHYDADGYTETGAGNAGLVVSQDTVNVFELGVGVDATWQYQTASGMEVEPSLHAGYRYDLVGDEVSTSNRFIGGTTAFAADGADPARSTFNVGAGMKLYTTDNWEFSANYDFEFKSDYDAHSGYLRAGVKF